MARSPIQRPYCLYCYAPMPAFREASARCGDCGRVNLHADQRVYWTREKAIVDLEIIAKTVLVVVLGGFSAVMLVTIKGSGMGQGWAAGMPILFGAYGWDTVSKLTRQSPYLSASIIWSIALAPLGLLIALPALFAFASWNTPVRIAVAATGILCFLSAFLAPFSGRVFQRWRDARIARLGGHAPGAGQPG